MLMGHELLVKLRGILETTNCKALEAGVKITFKITVIAVTMTEVENDSCVGKAHVPPSAPPCEKDLAG